MTIGKVGKYELIEPLGKGGMAEVFRGRSQGKDYAVKILLPELASSKDQCERFLREARNCAQIDHANVLKVISIDEGQEGVGEFSRRPYIVLEYIDGGSLQDAFTAPLPYERALEIGAAIADGLAWAHSEGIIHRDLKPGNVMLTKEGQVKVADWGLSKALEDEGKLTKEGTLLGTPKYMAPELIKGRPASVRSDLYALGVILYQLISGKSPIKGRTVAEILDGQLKQRPVKLKLLVPRLPSAVSDLISALLEKDPRLRPPSAEEVAVSLRAFLSAPKAEGVASAQPPTAVNQPETAKNVQRKTKPSASPIKKETKKRGPIIAIFLFISLIAICIFALFQKEGPKRRKVLVLRSPRFQSLNTLVIPFVGPLNKQLFLSIGDGRKYGKEYGPLQTIRTISKRTKVLELEIDEKVPIDGQVFVKIRKASAETRVYTVKTPSLPKEIEESLIDLGATRDEQMKQIYQNLLAAQKKRKDWRLDYNSKVASQLIEQAIDKVIGEGKVARIAPWVKRVLHKDVLPGSRQAKFFEPLWCVEAWLAYESKVPPLPWPSIPETLGVTFAETGKLTPKKGLILFAYRKAVDQYPFPAEAGGKANKVWLATKRFLRPLKKGAQDNLFVTTANAGALGKGRPPISTYRVAMPFTLKTRLKKIRRWPPRRASLSIVLHCLVRESQVTVSLNGKSPINFMNSASSHFESGQGGFMKFLIEISMPINPKALIKEDNVLKIEASSIRGTEAHAAFGVLEMGIYTSPI